MSDKGSPKGFAGLSGMVSDGTVTAAETSASAKYQMISLAKNPSMAAPWSGDGPGEGWKWGDFYITVQTRPVTQSEFMTGKMGGKAEPWEGLEYIYSATVFRDPEKNEHGKSSRPVLVIAVEKSSFGTMVGVFDGDVRSNLGGYTGRLDVESARATFFDFIGKRFALEGQPERLGTIEAIRPKVVTRDGSKIPENAGNAQGAGGGHPGTSPMGLFAGKRSLVLAGFVALVAWGILARPDFLFGYESYEECVIARMKGQPANVLATVQKACRKSNPAQPSNPVSSAEVSIYDGLAQPPSPPANAIGSHEIEDANEAGHYPPCKGGGITCDPWEREWTGDNKPSGKRDIDVKGNAVVPKESGFNFDANGNPISSPPNAAKSLPPADCEANAVNKDGRRLHGAAKAAFMKKCLALPSDNSNKQSRAKSRGSYGFVDLDDPQSATKYAEWLAQRGNFDIVGARKAGATDEDIIAFLEGRAKSNAR